MENTAQTDIVGNRRDHKNVVEYDDDNTMTDSKVGEHLEIVGGTVDSAEMTQVPPQQESESSQKSETTEELKNQLFILMNSLAILSAEKSRMEANFQADKKLLRNEREEYDRAIKELKDKLKRTQYSTHSELESVKCKLIMERHEHEKEHAENSAMIRELQKSIAEERRAKDNLERHIKELKNQVVNKTQNKILEAELEIANNKLRQANAAVKETPLTILSLQSEIAALKQQHREALREEKKRVEAAEHRTKVLETAHEARVAGLEARLAELSQTVGRYDRVREQDRHVIQKLKDQLSTLERCGYEDHADMSIVDDPKNISFKIKELYSGLLDMSNTKNSVNITDFLQTLNLRDIHEDLDYKEKLEYLQIEFENYKQETSRKSEKVNDFLLEKNVIENTTELNSLKTYSKSLEERIRVLNREASNIENEYKVKLEQQIQQIQEERIRFEKILTQKESEFRGKVAVLEHQLLRQRERSLALIEDKDQEITTLKSSFQALLTKSDASLNDRSFNSEELVDPSTDFVTALLTVESPPMIHYAQELARREIQVSGLRKQNSELESMIRKNRREFLANEDRFAEEIKILEDKIKRLEAFKSRDGANLEYLKNVIVNYLTSDNPSKRRHMMNAIATVLRFTSDEMEKIQRAK